MSQTIYVVYQAQDENYLYSAWTNEADAEAASKYINDDHQYEATYWMPVELDPGTWVCEKCGQRLAGPAALCNSGIHVGPGDGEEAQGEAVLLEDSDFEEVVDPHGV